MTAAMTDTRLDGRAAWTRLAIALLISMIGSAPMWTVVVVLPAVQAEFGTLRGGASLPYTMTMVGFMAGGVMMGRLADRFGVMVPVLIGAVSIGLGALPHHWRPIFWSLVFPTASCSAVLGRRRCSAR